MTHRFIPLLIVSALGLAGCSGISNPFKPAESAAPPPATVSPRPNPITPQGAKSAAGFDQSSEAEKAAALAAPAGGAELGRVTVSLGNPAEQGFWLRSNLVKTARPGTVRIASGKTAQVELRPLAGGGPQLSLAAYRALGLGLTDLPSVTVLGR